MLAGLMQQVPLTLNLVRERVADLYPNKTVTTRYCDRIHVISHAELLGRAGQLANFLAEIGVERGMRVATLAWNSHRHLELYLAVPCMGAVLHTINARLHALDIARLLAHAGDRVLFVDRSTFSNHRDGDRVAQRVWSSLNASIRLPTIASSAATLSTCYGTKPRVVDWRPVALGRRSCHVRFNPIIPFGSSSASQPPS
ncbi:AMP-binding enzyme [Bradyrhizobium brasilense]|uniref:AMP-binding enzyme n=3 Tax=Bradyrhizobium brasilense TaxID=1419277 RepID=A0A1G6NWV9_9BRAD|nr:AMP-binding protein [Bradyrhizobium brasilense]SDC71736.1 AMP-binding enzyme [Bradyrhizobium brasilense]